MGKFEFDDKTFETLENLLIRDGYSFRRINTKTETGGFYGINDNGNRVKITDELHVFNPLFEEWLKGGDMMTDVITKSILLDTVEKVKTLAEIMFSTVLTVDITSGRYVIDAKSIMGMFSLDLSKPVTLVIHNTDNDEADKLIDSMEEHGLLN